MNTTNTDLLKAAAGGSSLRLRGGYSRRRFLGFAGLLTGAGFLTLQACNKDDEAPGQTDDGINLGSGDTGILNYAYALEQLEAAFYIQVLSTPYTGLIPGSTEEALLRDIRDHEVAHREFLKAALGGSAIPDVELDFSSIDFRSRDSVLAASMAMEDLGVQAYNGAGKLLASADNLTMAGKIVSVEARHAAYIRNLVQPGSFADTSIVDPTNRIEMSKTPTQVLDIADTYFVTRINATALPTE